MDPEAFAVVGLRTMGGLEELFEAYGIRYLTASRIAEMGFTANTLLDMKEEELDDMMNSLSHIFRWDLLVGERYGIKAAIRAERRRLLEADDRRHHLHSTDHALLDALSHKGLSEEQVMQHSEKDQLGRAGSGDTAGTSWGAQQQRKKHRHRHRITAMKGAATEEDEEDEEEVEEMRRQREHPFIVTEPGEVARGKKNGLDYLFHLYDQCRDFLLQVQSLAKERGEKCPTKVTNQVFRYAKKAGASYINKPKMRHYVHCYALHCLDEHASNALRKSFKERGENVGAWRQACYHPLVTIAGRRAGWDIDAIFNAHPRLCIWYVPTKLRQLCHAHRHSSASAASSASTSTSAPTAHHLELPY
ncbi:hypothetical protein EUGRSUZ_K02192 [Eucalyptus grandis]|uniref:Floricaula/leafy-like transcription factor n=2 Tax=Eucalyptus grandis TaxID=71139 RepID=A0A059A335_EUCGR|nr:hypothetical protein EUGRSUZ_K02192 [Eucalyptus grandis]